MLFINTLLSIIYGLVALGIVYLTLHIYRRSGDRPLRRFLSQSGVVSYYASGAARLRHLDCYCYSIHELENRWHWKDCRTGTRSTFIYEVIIALWDVDGKMTVQRRWQVSGGCWSLRDNPNPATSSFLIHKESRMTVELAESSPAYNEDSKNFLRECAAIVSGDFFLWLRRQVVLAYHSLVAMSEDERLHEQVVFFDYLAQTLDPAKPALSYERYRLRYRDAAELIGKPTSSSTPG